MRKVLMLFLVVCVLGVGCNRNHVEEYTASSAETEVDTGMSDTTISKLEYTDIEKIYGNLFVYTNENRGEVSEDLEKYFFDNISQIMDFWSSPKKYLEVGTYQSDINNDGTLEDIVLGWHSGGFERIPYLYFFDAASSEWKPLMRIITEGGNFIVDDTLKEELITRIREYYDEETEVIEEGLYRVSAIPLIDSEGNLFIHIYARNDREYCDSDLIRINGLLLMEFNNMDCMLHIKDFALYGDTNVLTGVWISNTEFWESYLNRDKA